MDHSDLEQHLVAQIGVQERFFWHRLRWHAARQVFPKNARFSLLDVGAGAGVSGVYLRNQYPGARYYFIEPLPKLKRHLERTFGVDSNAENQQSGFKYDVVLLLDVIEHQANDADFLKSLEKYLDQDTQLVITAPAMPFLWSIWDERFGHFRRYTRSHLNSVITAAGYQVVYSQYLFPEMVIPGIIRKFSLRSSDPSEGEFPVLSDWVNGCFYFMGLFFQRFFSWAPVGSSVLAVVKKKS